MSYRAISDLNQVVLKRLYLLPRDFDLIVGILKSGMFPANLLALYLNKPVTDLGSSINGHIYKTGERGKFIEIKHSVIYVIPGKQHMVDYVWNCKDSQDYVNAINETLQHNSTELINKRIQFAKTHTWTNSVKKLYSHIHL